MDEETKAYAFEERGGAHVVTDGKGDVVLGCGDPATAERYAAILNEAWRRGYKAGYRKGREA